jgi:hypothetical protein
MIFFREKKNFALDESQSRLFCLVGEESFGLPELQFHLSLLLLALREGLRTDFKFPRGVENYSIVVVRT